FFVTGDSKPNPLVYALLFPLYMALSALDLWLPASHGAAILGVGQKEPSARAQGERSESRSEERWGWRPAH
ncbi:MAG TPA: hypothetical protein VIE88_13555, partial [Vicinamibacteria bacterium]